MLAVCESRLPTLSKLRESVSGLQPDVIKRDKILMDFSTVATTQAKLITHLKSMTATDSTTLPWTGSITTGILALAESHWHHQGAQPKTLAPSATCLRPAETQFFIRDREDGVEAPVSSTPLKPREPWSVVHRGTGARPSPPPPNLGLQDFPPVGALSSSPPEPVHSAGRGSHQSKS